jgi:HlyD family secretion protein
MARELHGVRELAPDDTASRWVAAELEARVDRKLLEAGATVTADTVLLQLSNPDVDQASVAANLRSTRRRLSARASRRHCRTIARPALVDRGH